MQFKALASPAAASSCPVAHHVPIDLRCLTWAGARCLSHTTPHINLTSIRKPRGLTPTSQIRKLRLGRQSTGRNKHSQASYMLGSLPTISQGGIQRGSSPRSLRQQEAAFMAPRSGPGCSVSCPQGCATHSLSEHAHRGQDTVKGTLLALLLCLRSPSTSSMTCTHLTNKKPQAELRPSWDPVGTLRD